MQLLCMWWLAAAATRPGATEFAGLVPSALSPTHGVEGGLPIGALLAPAFLVATADSICW